MAPLIPRMHLFEFDDQPWFPPFFREKVQAALTITWTTHIPFLQKSSPAQMVARLLPAQLKSTIRDYVFIDFCAGAGGPTPSIEKHLNQTLTGSPSSSSSSSSSSAQENEAKEPVQFVLTDLHPNISSWADVSAGSKNLTYIPSSVDAANAPADLIAQYKNPKGGGKGKKIFRLFNLAFHHFDDPLAKDILRNTVETSDGFGIFELQSRTMEGFFACLLFGIGIFALAPYYAWKWRSPLTLVFTFLIPILPFVLIVDGFTSALRTRTAEEVEALLRTCGAEGCDIQGSWEVRSGKEQFMWPVGDLEWIICVKQEHGGAPQNGGSGQQKGNGRAD